MSSTIPVNAVRASGQDDERESHPGRHQEAVAEETRPEVKKPPLYKVLMINDDFTPMEFVVEVLEGFFHMNREQATRIMLTVHTQGRAVCGIFTRDVAETKAALVIDYARENQHPLMCQVEQA